MFKDHYQPIVPADLGFYDLRIPEVQRQQAELAKEYGVDGFIYYQYWFGNGKMLLEKPAEAMLKDVSIDLPFCFCWANETWKGIWHGLDNPAVLIEQVYPGKDDFTAYFNYLLPFFKDKRYIKVDNKPMFHIYRLQHIPDLDVFFGTFNELAQKAGFDGICFIASGNIYGDEVMKRDEVYGVVGLDNFQKLRYSQIFMFEEGSFPFRVERKLKSKLGYFKTVAERTKPLIIDYKKGVEKLKMKFPHQKYISAVVPNWDNSARSGKKSLIFKNATPEAWQENLQKHVDELLQHPENPQMIIVKSWNEWAEGNYVEPDLKFGHKWLQAIKNVKSRIK